MKQSDPIVKMRGGSAKTWALIALILLLAIFVPVGLYLVSLMSFGNGTTGTNLSTPDTGVTPAAVTAAPAALPANRPARVANNQNDLGPTSNLNLLVIDVQTKQPIAGLRIQSYGRRGFNGTTGADGRARVTVPAGQNPNVNIRVSGKNYVPKELIWAPYNPGYRGAIPQDYTMEMEHGTKISGKIADDAGQPVADANVYVDFQKKYSTPHERVDLSPYNRNKPIKSGPDGMWSFDGAPLNCDEIEIAAWDYKHVTGDYWMLQTVAPASKYYDGSAVLTLHRGVTLDGTVVNPDGAPVADASVSMGQQRFSSNAIPPRTTDATGHFSYQFDPGQSINLTIEARNYAPQMKQFTMGSQKQTLNIQLSKPHRITGSVVDASGKPVVGAQINVQSWQGTNGTLNANFQTDGAGHFHWNEAPAEPVTVSVNARNLRGVQDQVLTPDQDNVIKLSAISHIRGTVTDAETGQPIENAQIIMGILWNTQQTVTWQPGWNPTTVTAGGRFNLTDEWPYPGVAVKVEAPGYLPVESRIIRAGEGDATLDLKMKPGKDLVLTVQSADGKPVAGATAAIALPGMQLYIQDGRDMRNNMNSSGTSGADGRIDFPPQTGKFRIAVIADEGYAESDQDSVAKSPVITLAAWGRIEGRVMVGSKPAAGVDIDVVSSQMEPYDPQQIRIYNQLTAKTDDDGKFSLNRVPPGSWNVGRRVPVSFNSWTNQILQTAAVEPGKTVTVIAGGTGRPVIGKVILPAELSGRSDWAYNFCRIFSQPRGDLGLPPIPLLVRMSSAEARQKWVRDWIQTDAGKAYLASQRKTMANRRDFGFSVNADGTFRVEDVPAGEYQVSINIRQTTTQNNFGQPIAMGYASFTIPEMPGGRSDDPLQLDPISVVILAKYKVGDSVADLKMKTPEGKGLKFSDFRGKYLLIDFFHPLDTNIATFKDVHASYGQDSRLALLTINPQFLMNGESPVRLNNNPWPQAAFAGESDWSVNTAIQTNFGLQNSNGAWLLGPDGKVVAEDLSGDAVKLAVMTALGAPATQPTTAP